MNQPMNFFRTDTVDPSTKLTEEVAMFTHLDTSLVAARQAEEKDRYKDRPKSLGAGRVGHPHASLPWDRGCERALWFEMKMYPSDRPFPAKLYRIFEMGHAAEKIIAENLRLAGFTLITEDPQGQQYGFAIGRDPETGHARYKGFCDGVVIAGPEEIALPNGDRVKLKYPFLWENKGVNEKKFNAFVANGVEKSHPQYYGQVQQYQNFLQLYPNPALLTMLNRNDGELRCEFIRFNQKHTQAIIDRAARIIEAKGPLMLDRAADEYEKLPCKWCDFQSHCKAAEANRGGNSADPQAAPAWLKQD